MALHCNVLLLLFVVAPGDSLETESGRYTENWRDRCRQSLRHVEDVYSNLSGFATCEKAADASGFFERTRLNFDYRRDVGARLDAVIKLQLSRGKPTGNVGRRRVAVNNRHYAFLAAGASAGAPLTLKDVTRPKNVLTDPFSMNCTRYLFMPFAIFSRRISELIDHPSFEVVSVEECRTHEPALKIRFELDNHLIGGGWMVLLPTRDWVLREFECRLTGSVNAPMRGRVDYDGEFRGVPAVSRVVFEIPAHGIRDEVNFTGFTTSATPAEAFTLSAHGLIPTRHSGLNELLYTATAAASIVVLMLFLILRRAAPSSNR